MMSRVAICVAFLLAFAGGGRAATIAVSQVPSADTVMVRVSGTLVLSDAEQFRHTVAGLPKAIIAFHSDGGSVAAAIDIGRQIRLRNFSTLVPDDTRCASACALAWLGGTQRLMGSNTRIGFHAAYDPRSGAETGVGNALVGAYLSQIGLPDKAIVYVTQAPPKSMTWLTMSEARQVGIDVAVSTIALPQARLVVAANGGPDSNRTETPGETPRNSSGTLSFQNIAGKWCGLTTNYEFSRDLLIVTFLDHSPTKRFTITSFDYTDDKIVMHWLSNGEKLYTEFSEFSSNGRNMAQVKSNVGPRRPFHRC
jgi:hypothetical protein